MGNLTFPDRLQPDPAKFHSTHVSTRQAGSNMLRNGTTPFYEKADLISRAKRLGVVLDPSATLTAMCNTLRTWTADTHSEEPAEEHVEDTGGNP